MSQPLADLRAGPSTYVLHDVDEAMRVGGDLFYPHRLTPAAPGEFRCDISAGSIGNLMIGHVSYSGAVDIEVGPLWDYYGVNVPESGRLDIAIGHRAFTALPGMAAVIGPIGELRVSGWQDGHDRLSMLRFDRLGLEGELSRLVGEDVSEHIRFPCLMDLTGERASQWIHLARAALVALGEPQSLFWSPLIAAQFSSALATGLLLATEHQYREVLDASGRRTAPPLIRRAVAFIEENADSPLTIPQIAAAVGVSVRTLHRGFADHLNSTPARVLDRTRLDRVHEDLVRGSADETSVAQIATKWGFYHLGRFAARYRKAYGVAPSTTLRKPRA